MSSINAVTAQAARNAASVPTVLNSAALVAFFNENGEAAARKADSSRMKWLVSLFSTADATAIKEATKEYVSGVAGTWKGAKGEKVPSHINVARVRASEVKALFGGLKFGGLSVEAFATSYHTALTVARSALKEKGVRWNGAPVLDAKTRNAVSTTAQRTAAVDKAARALAATQGHPCTPEQLMQLFASAEETAKSDAVKSEAERIVKTYGPIMAEQIASLILGAVAAEKK